MLFVTLGSEESLLWLYLMITADRFSEENDNL